MLAKNYGIELISSIIHIEAGFPPL